MLRPQGLKDVNGVIINAMKTWTRRLEEFRVGKGSSVKFPEVMLRTLRSCFSDMWYNMVQTIREAEGKASLSGIPSVTMKPIVNYRETWIELGKACDLDEIQERRRMDAIVARYCSWKGCKFFNLPSDKPLRVCKGCKTVRYCSKECQVTCV